MSFDAEIFVDGIMEVSVSAANQNDAMRELSHYIMLYSEPGKKIHVKTNWKTSIDVSQEGTK